MGISSHVKQYLANNFLIVAFREMTSVRHQGRGKLRSTALRTHEIYVCVQESYEAIITLVKEAYL